MLVKADLHIHSCLSPCASLEMSPTDIVHQAHSVGLNLIALTDHNSALNAKTFGEICMQFPDIHCLYGIEVCSTEEVHNLCLFEDLDAVLELDQYVYQHLPDISNKPDLFGDQVYVDSEDVVLGEVDKYLGSATDLTISQIKDYVQQANGLFIPAHIDRTIFSIISQLGFLPDDDYDAIELSKGYCKHQNVVGEAPIKIDKINHYQTISNSDAHYLEDIAKVYNQFEIDEISINHLRELFKRRQSEIIVNF